MRRKYLISEKGKVDPSPGHGGNRDVVLLGGFGKCYK